MIKSLLNSCGDSLKTSYACQTALGNLQKVNKNELEQYQTNYKIISNKLVGGKPLIHAFSNTELQDDFVQVEESLEDVFFAKLNELV